MFNFRNQKSSQMEWNFLSSDIKNREDNVSRIYWVFGIINPLSMSKEFPSGWTDSMTLLLSSCIFRKPKSSMPRIFADFSCPFADITVTTDPLEGKKILKVFQCDLSFVLLPVQPAFIIEIIEKLKISGLDSIQYYFNFVEDKRKCFLIGQQGQCPWIVLVERSYQVVDASRGNRVRQVYSQACERQF